VARLGFPGGAWARRGGRSFLGGTTSWRRGVLADVDGDVVGTVGERVIMRGKVDRICSSGFLLNRRATQYTPYAKKQRE
jgi:hypothetical protein